MAGWTGKLRVSVFLLIGALAVLSIMLLTQCAGGEQQESAGADQPLFRKVPVEHSGIRFFNQVVETNLVNIINNIYYYNGSGVAVGDINNDGLPDIYFASMLGYNQLFLNLGDMKFRDITTSAGVQGTEGITTGVNMADVNADGYLDIYVCKTGFRNARLTTNHLFINHGDLRFSDEAASYGLADSSFSNQSYFFDMDLDGDLDMYLVNHPLDFDEKNRILKEGEEVPDLGYQSSDKLYENRGNGRFDDITREAGVYNMNWGLSASVGDINGDGWPDVFVANDFLNADNVYINNGDGTFTDRCKEYLRHISFSSMGSDYADINNDGFNDLFVLDMAWADPVRNKLNMMYMSPDNFRRITEAGYHYTYPESMMHLNLGNNSYAEIGQMLGIGKTGWSWTPLIIDLDNDGWKDIFISNGILKDIVDKDFEEKVLPYTRSTPTPRYYDDLIPQMPVSEDHNFIYRNNGGLTFTDASLAWGMEDPTNANGAACADLDLDGDLDLVTNNLHEPSMVYENISADREGSNYLQIRLKGPEKNLFAIGSRVEVEHGGQMQRQDLYPSRGYMSSSDYILHFGLGNSDSVDLIRVTWPDGKITQLEHPAINGLLEVTYGERQFIDQAGTSPDSDFGTPLFFDGTTQHGIDHMHVESEYDDFAREPLLPYKFSENGPYLAVADVNGDGLEDFFIGGAAGQPGAIYLQGKRAGFSKSGQRDLEADRAFEDLGALFIDVDLDGDQDLYVVSGSNEFQESRMYQDRLYLNNGSGAFARTRDALPEMRASGQAVKSADYDGDGDPDLVICGRIKPGEYPASPESYLLENREGTFVDVTPDIAPDLQNVGMVSDLEFTDIDNDGDPDLMLLGDWMPITMLVNDNGIFSRGEVVDQPELTTGWWFSLEGADMDGDGDTDFVAGNLGQNNRYHPDPDDPLFAYYSDFDNNGTGDLILSRKDDGFEYPVRIKEYLVLQLPFLENKYPDFTRFASSSLQEIFSPEQLRVSLQLQATMFESCILINRGNGNFDVKKLPRMVQISPLMDVEILDVNNDGYLDVVAAGNVTGTDASTIRYDAGSGIVLLGDGTGDLQCLSIPGSGLNLTGDVRDIESINLADGKRGLLAGSNDEALILMVIE